MHSNLKAVVIHQSMWRRACDRKAARATCISEGVSRRPRCIISAACTQRESSLSDPTKQRADERSCYALSRPIPWHTTAQVSCLVRSPAQTAAANCCAVWAGTNTLADEDLELAYNGVPGKIQLPLAQGGCQVLQITVFAGVVSRAHLLCADALGQQAAEAEHLANPGAESGPGRHRQLPRHRALLRSLRSPVHNRISTIVKELQYRQPSVYKASAWRMPNGIPVFR